MKIVTKKTETIQSTNTENAQDRVLKCAEIECPLCNIIRKCECDCDKCGVTGCYECVTGGHGTGENLNICDECL